MAEKEEQQKPPINHVLMTHTCAECDEDCYESCKNGTCRLTQKETT